MPKATREIRAYTHSTAEPVVCSCKTHPEGARFYASVSYDGDKHPATTAVVLAAGPFATHSEALAIVDRVRNLVLAKYNPGGRAHWHGYGTIAMAADYTKPGKLNAELGLEAA